MSRFTYWGDDEAVDGSGQNVRGSAERLAEMLNLSYEQATPLLHALGNILPLIGQGVEMVEPEELRRRIGAPWERLHEIDGAIRRRARMQMSSQPDSKEEPHVET